MIEKAVIGGERARGMCKIWGLKRRGFRNVESPHILVGSFRTNKNGCRVSCCKN